MTFGRARGRRRRLDRHFDELKRSAPALGPLYNAEDYPDSLVGLFAVTYDFPSVDPPYLVALSPGLYEQGRRGSRPGSRRRSGSPRRRSRPSSTTGGAPDRAPHRPNDDGTPKVFRDSAVGNLVEFFDRFRQLNVHTDAQLDDLVVEAQRIVRGRPTPPGHTSRGRGSPRSWHTWGRRSTTCWSIGPGGGHCLSRGGGLMQLVIAPDGEVRCLYAEPIDLTTLARPSIFRQSRRADTRRPLDRRHGFAVGATARAVPLGSEALEAERTWLEEYWLLGPA